MTRTLILMLLACTAAGCAPQAGPETAGVERPAVDGVHRFRVGRIEAAAIRDGALNAPNDGKTIWQGPDAALAGRALAAAGLPSDRVRLDIQALLLRIGDRVVLIDSGFGRYPGAGELVTRLQAAGIAPEAVTDVLITHSHRDHAGGLATEAGTATFPNARVRMAEAEWAAMRADPANAALVRAITPRVAPFAPGAVVLPGITSVPVRGHTPGHMAYQVRDGATRLLAIGDSAHHYVVSLRLPEATISFDRDAPTAEASRRALLNRAVDEQLQLFAPHFPFPGLGTVAREGDGFRWVAGE